MNEYKIIVKNKENKVIIRALGVSGSLGQPKFSGEGPPPAELSLSAVIGDEYLDNLTGDIYKYLGES